MSILNNRIECVKRLINKSGYYDLLEWLEDNKMLDKEKWRTADSLQLKSELIVSSLSTAENQEKLFLLDYEWSILPLEIIKITCVTEREKKEFTYGI
jgi:hypothetical protein